ncbi:MAG: Crp/Fnr family transcriptional regulator [Bacteroidota bacterium]
MNSPIETELIKPFQVERKTYQKGQLLEASGVFSKYLYYINAGACKQYRINKQGDSVIFRLMSEGAFCAAAYSLITGNKSFDFIECCEDSDITVYNYHMILAQYDNNIALSNLSRRIVEQYFIEEQERAITLANFSPTARYDKFCQEKGTFLQRFNLGDIASYLGMRRETLSRIRSKRF